MKGQFIKPNYPKYTLYDMHYNYYLEQIKHSRRLVRDWSELYKEGDEEIKQTAVRVIRQEKANIKKYINYLVELKRGQHEKNGIHRKEATRA